MLYKLIKNLNVQLLSIMLLMLSLSCSHKKAGPAAGIIPSDKMGKILTDMHLADAIANQNFPLKGGNDTIAWKTKSFTHLILQKYQTDTATFNRSFIYYVQRPEEMDAIYSKMVTDMTRLQAKLPRDKIEKMPVPVKHQAVRTADLLPTASDPLMGKKLQRPAATRAVLKKQPAASAENTK